MTTKEFVLYYDCGFGYANIQLFDIPLTIQNEPDMDKCKFWIKLDHRSNIIQDKSLFGNHAYLHGDPKVAQIKNIQNKKHSLQFKGTPQSKVTIPNSPTLDNLLRFTLSFWIYPEDNIINKTIISKGFTKSTTTLALGGFAIYFDENGILQCAMRNGVSNLSQSSTNIIAENGLNKWYNIVITKTGSDLFVYVNGEYQNNNSAIGTALINTSDIIFGGGTDEFKGYLDDVILWRTALDPDEIKEYYDNGILPNREITSVWSFDEGDVSADMKTLDSWSYNTGVMPEGTEHGVDLEYSPVFVKPSVELTSSIVANNNIINTTQSDIYLIEEKYNNAISANRLQGYRFDGKSVYLRVPERTEHFRIEAKPTTAVFHFYIVMVTRDLSISNEGRVKQILFQKIDHEDLQYYYVCQIDSTGRIYLTIKYENVTRQFVTEKRLKMQHYYQLSIGINIPKIIEGAGISQQVCIFINGRQERFETVEVDIDNNLFQSNNDNNVVDDFDFLIGSTNNGLVGKNANEIYEMRMYSEYPTFEKVIGLVTTKTTTDNIPKGKVFRVNESKIPETLPKTRELLQDERLKAIELTDSFTAQRFGNEISDMAFVGIYNLSDSFHATRIGVNPSLWSLEVEGNNEHVDFPAINFQKKFTISVWVKYKGKQGTWGGVFTNLDGLKNGNRLLLNGTVIRYNGQFYNDNEKWDDFKVTVPNYTNQWHHIILRYDGDDRRKFEIWYDGVLVASFNRKGSVQSGGNDEIWVGKGERRGYYLIGNIDDLFIFNAWLSDDKLQDLYRHIDVTVNDKSKWRFENNVKDTSEDGKYKGQLRNGAQFSPDVPP